MLATIIAAVDPLSYVLLRLGFDRVGGSDSAAARTLLGFLVVRILIGVVRPVCARIGALSSGQIASSERNDLLKAILTADWSWRSRQSHGELVDSVLPLVDEMAQDCWTFVQKLIEVVVSGAVALILLLNVHWVAGVMVVPYLAIGVWISLRIGNRCERTAAHRLRMRERMFARVSEFLSGITTIVVSRLESTTENVVEARSRDLGSSETRHACSVARYQASASFVELGGHAVVVVVLLVLVASGRSTTGQVVSMFAYASTLLLQLSQINYLRQLRQSVNVISHRLDRMRRAPSGSWSGHGDARFGPVSLVDVTAGYGRGPVLVGFSERFEKGERVLVCGKSGAGKTTLARLILCSIRPEVGDLQLNGASYPSLDQSSIKDLIASLSQQPFLFDSSLEENISWWLPGCDKSTIEEALRLVGLSETAKRAETVGEHGAKLSGGQRQRLALARCIASHREILVLDEPFSQLDIDSERRICEQLSVRTRGQTIVVISHRQNLGLEDLRTVQVDRVTKP